MPRNKHLFIVVHNAQDPWRATVCLQLAPKMMTLCEFRSFAGRNPRKEFTVAKLFKHKEIALGQFLDMFPGCVVRIETTYPASPPSLKELAWSDIVLPETHEGLMCLANMLDMSISLHVFCQCASLCRHILKMPDGTAALNGLYANPSL